MYLQGWDLKENPLQLRQLAYEAGNPTGERVEWYHSQFQITFYCITMTATLKTSLSYVEIVMISEFH